MAPSKLRKAIGAVKDQTSISLAMVANSSSISDLDVAIVKATRHEEFPADERYIREILSLTCYSRAHISACVNTLSRRLSKTKNWTVALKTLMLIHRLLIEGDPAYEEEIFFSTRRGTRLLNMCDFRDTSRSDAWDYSAFIRTFALYLDERLEYKMQGRRGKRSSFGRVGEGAGDAVQLSNKTTPVQVMKKEHMFSKMQHLQQILDRFLACRPTGGAKNNRVVFVALYAVVKESFQIYYEIVELMAIFVDRFMELDILSSGDDYVTSEEHSDTLTLALFDGIGHPASSAPSLPNQSVAQGGGFDMSLLDGMYQQGAIVQAAVGNHEGSGSASSVALGSAGRPAMLALPAPPAPNGSIMASGGDPFTASLAVAPPSYVQMSVQYHHRIST